MVIVYAVFVCRAIYSMQQSPTQVERQASTRGRGQNEMVGGRRAGRRDAHMRGVGAH